MTNLKRPVRPVLALLALGTLGLGALTACAPTQSAQPATVQLPTGEPQSPYETRADAATLVFRTQAARAGALDLLLDGTPVLRQVSPAGSYRVVFLPPGQHTLSVRNSVSGLELEALTETLQAGESYALLFDAVTTGGPGFEYRLRLGQGSAAVSNLVY